MSESAAKTVFVACKLPHGIKIRDQREEVGHEPVMGGGSRKVKVYRPIGKTYRIRGPIVPEAFKHLVEVVGGYAITQGMPADIFNRWMGWNAETFYVKQDLIFGGEDGDAVRGRARELSSFKSGFEPLDVTMKLNTETGRMEYVDERLKQTGINQFAMSQLDLVQG